MSEERRTETRILPVKLTVDELAEWGKKAAASMGDAEAAESEKKDADEGFKARIDRAWAAAAQAGRVIRDGAEPRDVEVELTYDFTANRVTARRQDTGEVVEDRAMSAGEREVMNQPRLGAVVPICPDDRCGHPDDVHAMTYESPAGDDGKLGRHFLVCSATKGNGRPCRCRREVEAPESGTVEVEAGPAAGVVGTCPACPHVDHRPDPCALCTCTGRVAGPARKRRGRGKAAAAGA